MSLTIENRNNKLYGHAGSVAVREAERNPAPLSERSKLRGRQIEQLREMNHRHDRERSELDAKLVQRRKRQGDMTYRPKAGDVPSNAHYDSKDRATLRAKHQDEIDRMKGRHKRELERDLAKNGVAP